MRVGLCPAIAIIIITLYLLVEIFKEQINNAPEWIQTTIIILTILLSIGFILLALWDTKMIGSKKVK